MAEDYGKEGEMPSVYHVKGAVGKMDVFLRKGKDWGLYQKGLDLLILLNCNKYAKALSWETNCISPFTNHFPCCLFL